MLKKIAVILFLAFSMQFAFAESSTAPNNTSISIAQKADQPTIIKPYRMRHYNRDIRKLYAEHTDSRSPFLLKRIKADSEFFLGKPYLLGALGEGKAHHFDKSPIYRSDRFDCVTFVSTVLALVHSQNLYQFQTNILKVRYRKGIPTFLNRNHFVSVDWNINNQKGGYLADITKLIFPRTVKTAVALIDRPAWFHHLKENRLKLFKQPSRARIENMMKQLHSLGGLLVKRSSRLNYEPLNDLYGKNGKPRKDRFQRIPDGVVIEIVCPNWNLKNKIGTNMNISHLGFGLWIKGKLIYREASQLKHKVIDVPLTEYLEHYLNSPTVKGIHIEHIRNRERNRMFWF